METLVQMKGDRVGIWEKKGVIISELKHGKQLTIQLRKQLHSKGQGNVDSCGILIHQILSCYDNALSLFRYNSNPNSNPNPNPILLANQLHNSNPPHCPQLDSKKRKRMPKWSKQVVVCSEKEFEEQLEDGFKWRKYGQKVILGANHPRAYYRCTHRYTQGCLATKQVQRTDKDPSLVELVYKGFHNCVHKGHKNMNENINVERNHKEKKSKPSHEMLITSDEGTEEFPSELKGLVPISFTTTLSDESKHMQIDFTSEQRNCVATSYDSQDFSIYEPDLPKIESNLNLDVDFSIEDLDVVLIDSLCCDLDPFNYFE